MKIADEFQGRRAALRGQSVTVIDWQAKPEPWRSIGLRFCRDLGLAVDARKSSLNPLCGIRKTRGLTQDGLGALAGMSQRQISRIECNSVKVRPATRQRIAAALGVAVTDIWP